jgi:formate dehydrogenase
MPGAGGEGEAEVAKVLCVLYDDPVDGYPRAYARDAIPRIERYYDGQTTPTPERIDFEPGELLGSVSGELGLRRFLEERGHAFVVTSDKDGPDSVFEQELPEAEIVISQPFWPAYLTAVCPFDRQGRACLKFVATWGKLRRRSGSRG